MNPLTVNNSRGSQSKKISLKAFVLIGIMLAAWGSQAQITNYRFSVGSTTPVDITGQGTLIGAGSAIGAAGTTTAIGFNFRYLGTVASHYSVNAAGLFRFGYSASAVAATTESANNITTTTNTVKLMPWWDATATGSAASNGGVFSQLSGTAPNRVLTVQWNVAYTVGNPTGTRFQLKLYETTNVIEFVYIQNPGVAVSSTIGLGGFTSTEYLNIYTTANGPVPTTANADGTNVNTVLPGNNVVYTFTPIENEVNACSTNPLGQGMAPALWLKADAPSSVTRTYLNVPSTSRTSNVSDANSWAANFTAANSVMTTTTGWLANAANGGNTIRPTGAYLQLDLGSVRTIDGLIVAGCSTCSPAGFVLDYSVQISSDNTTWTSAGTYQGPADAVTGRNNDFPAPVTCRYVRIYPGAFSTYRVIRTDAYTKTTTSYADNAKVSFWEDQGYNNNNGVQGTAANQMTYRTNQINGNPALVSANASNTWLDIPDQRNLRTTFWVVQDRTSSGTNYFHVLYGGASTPSYHSGTTGDLQYSAVMTDAQVNWWKDGVDGTVATKYDFGTNGKPNIATSYANAAATPIGAQTISFQTGNTRSWEGLIAEILSYNHQLGSSDIQKIETYLGVKYGIELGHDYILADGTVLWNRTTNAAYDFNIFGIGRSDCQGLHQRQSFSVNPAGRFLTIGNNSIIGATNSSTSGNDIAANNAYLLVGDNNGALNFDYGLNLSQTYFYLGRRWKVEQAGISGPVKIRIPAFGNSNVNQLPDLSKISSSVVTDSKLYLAIDPNGDGNWSDATYTEATLSGTGTSAVYEVNSALPDGAIFTVAMQKNLTDSDSDNVADLYDIDDDNDGIPDTTENPASGTFSVYTFNRTNDAAVAQNVPVRISGSFNTDLVLDQRTAGTYNYNFTNWKLLASNVYLSSDNKISISMLPENTTIVGSYVFADAMLITNGVNTWVIDDSQSGFTLVGTWTNQTSASYQGNMRFTSTYTGRTATWTFTLPQVNTDTDSDGKRNALDLDSDGDGCSDALEAGATGITTADYKFSGTDANANGLVDAVESGTTGTVKYASTYSEFAVSSTYNACSDSDSDAVGDLFDIDDDNDGIPDLREGCVAASPQADLRTYTWSGGDGDMTVTASTSTNLTFTGLANAWRTRLSEETFSLPLEMVVEPYSSSANIMFGFSPEGAAPVDNNWNGTAYGFFLDGSLNGNARYDATYVGGWAGVTGKKVRLLITTAGVFTVELDGAVLYRQTGLPTTKYRLYTAAYANNSTLSNVKFYPPSAIQSCPLDTDGDGVANRLDLDSDGDGCSDALESGATTDVTANFKFTSNFGTNGLANALETVADNGVLNYTANYDAYALSRQFSICKNADSDGVRDHLDVDMDNDGVVNAAEAPQCYYTASDFLYGDRDSFIKITSGLALGFSYPFLNKLVDGDNGTSTTSYAVRFTATTAAGVPMYSFDMGVPVQLASIYLGFASTTPHNDNNTILTLQGSFDNNTWTSLNAGTGYGSATGQTAVPGVTGAVNAQLFSVTQNAARYRYYRIFWTSGGGINGNGNATEVYFVTAADHQASLHPKASCTTDIDGDGLLNTVDLDSDGDGCSDARESSATTSNTANYVFSGTDANGNGLVDAVESGTTGNVNYTLTYQWAMYSSVSGCTDTDGDVSADLRDLDDDNDGVPDAVESPACFNTANQARFINKISSSLTSPDDNQTDGNIQVLTDLAFNTYTFNWDAGQQLMGAELFRMEMVTYVNVPNVAIFSNTSFGTGTRAKLQGSRDGTNWLDLTTTDTDLNTTVNKSFPVGQNAGEYLFYRIIGTTTGLTVTTTTIGEVSLGIPLNFNSSASPNIFSTCTTDLDGDGKLNHQDLNADGDGCNDAFEASATTLKTADYVFAGPFGANGLADALETTAESGTVKYTSTFADYGLNANIDYCIDTDNDGITDVNDIDDDNDAVPDFEEQGNCTFPSISPSSLTFSGNATLTITSTSIKADYPPGTSWVSSYSTQSFKLPLHLEWTASTTGNGMIGLIPVAATKTVSNWTDGAYKVYHNAGSILGYMPIAWNFNLPYTANQKMEIDINENGVVTVKQAGVLIHRFQGAVSKYNVAVSANTSKTFENIKFTAWSTLATCVELDTDGDGLVNRRDLDSDGDGCNDAVEAGAAITTTAIPFTGTVGANGYVDAKENPAESGEPTFSSTYSFYGLARTKNACADTDNDGVGDLTDVDLENDGVPDYVEANCANPLFVNRVSNATTKTISGVVLKEADSIAYKVLMSGPAVSYTATNFDGANGIHFLVNGGSNTAGNVLELVMQLNAYAGENSPTSVAPSVRYVEFGPSVPFNSVAAGTTAEPKNIVLNWPGAYGVVYDPANQLSTHNTGDKIYNGDMLVQNGTLAFGNATTDPKWKVRLYMTTDATAYEIKANIFGDGVLNNEGFGFNINACSVYDDDADGVYNELDTDSDGDGCSDAYEGGAVNTPGTTTVTGTAGANGLISTLETDDSFDALINYNSTYYLARSASLNLCADTDNDGVKDLTDIDDDNDGILDTEETSCGQAFFTLPTLSRSPNLQTLTGSLSKGNAEADLEINLIGVATTISTSTGFDNSKGGLHYTLTDNDNVYGQTYNITPGNSTIIKQVNWGVNVTSNLLNTTAAIEAQTITLVWNPEVKARIYDPADQLTNLVTGDFIKSGSSITTRANYTVAASTWRIEFLTDGQTKPFFLQVDHKTGSTANIDSWGIYADLCYEADQDGDDLASRLDTDSEDDGCSDAFEAGAAATPGGSAQTLSGPFGANGLANSIETNDTPTAAITYAATTFQAYSAVSACGDTDQDGVPDREDIDDDNDGILDTDEYECATGLFVRSYVIPTGTGIGFGGSYNNGNNRGTGTITFTNLSSLTTVTDQTSAANFKVNDANTNYSIRAALAPTNGIISAFSFGPNLPGNSANAAIVNGQQSITVTWNYPIGGYVFDPDDQLSSHVDGQGINPGDVIVTRAAYSVATSTWKMAIPLNFLSTDVVFQATFQGTANFGDESFGVGLDICNRLTDSDKDKKANAVDTDSDGDGCFDAVEVQHFKNESLTSEFVAGPYGANGMTSQLENNDTQLATTSYTRSNNYANALIRGCADLDGDNISDNFDIDDDNDGITDQSECPVDPPITSYTLVKADATGNVINMVANTGAIIGKITARSVKNCTVKDMAPNNADKSVNGFLVDGANANTVDRVAELVIEPVSSAFLKIKILINEGGNGPWLFHPRNLRIDGGIAGRGVIKGIPQPSYLKEKYKVGDTIRNTDRISTNFTQPLGASTNKVFIQVQYEATATVAQPLVIRYTWNAIAGTFANENWGFQLLELTPTSATGACDTDGDKISDDRDFDSDNDGCPDVREAGHQEPFTTSVFGDPVITGVFGVNGLSSLVETNDTFSAAMNYSVEVSENSKKDYINQAYRLACDAVTATDDSNTTTEETAVSGNVLANDTYVGVNKTLTITKFLVQNVRYNPGQTATIPNVGTITISAAGAYTFTPVANYNGTVPVITYTVSEGRLSDFGDLNITVTPVNDPPVAADNSNTTLEDTPVTGTTILANDSDIDNDLLTVSQFVVDNTTYLAGETANISGVGTLKINADGTYTFTPALNYNGAVPVATYTVSDGNGGTATAKLTLTITPVNDNPVAVDDAKTTAEELAVSGTVIANDTDVDTDVLSVTEFTVGGSPFTAGQTATITGKGTIKINADGTYTFTPATDFNGTVPAIPYTISDGKGGTATANLNITVTPVNDNPVAVNDTNTTAEDTPLNGTVLANDTDIDGDALSVTGFSVSNQNFTAGQTATISGVGTIKVNADGTYTFTPNQDYNGTAPTVAYTISDGKGGTATANLVITVTPVNDNPVAIDDAKTTAEETVATGTVLANDSDVDGDALTVTGFTVEGTTLNTGQTGTITGKGTIKINADGTYTFTPAADFNGTVPAIPYSISDGNGGTATANLNITVTPVNDNPVAVNDTNTTPEDTPVNGTVLTNDSDIDSDALSVTGFSVGGQNYTYGQTGTISGVGTIKINVDGTYTFTPAPDYTGTAPTVAYTISDGKGGTATANVVITVTPVNDNPVAIDDAKTTAEDTAVSGTVLTNDSDVDGDVLTVTGFTAGGTTITAGQTGTIAGKGTIKINADGTYTFTPAADFNGTVPAVPYTISDGNGGTATANLNITVTSVNDNPVAVNDTNTTVEDTPVSGNVITNDTDVDGDALTVTGFSAGGQNYTAGQTGTISGVGTIEINADGTYTFSPALNYNGNVSAVTYTITDGKGGTATATLSISVTPDNDAPVANDDYNTTPEDTALNGDVLSNDSDLEGDVLSVTGFSVNSISYAAGATATLNSIGTIVLGTNGTYTFTPVANFNGTVPTVTYSISDGNGGTASAKLYITVSPDNDSPAAVDDSGTTPEDTPFSANALANDNDPEGDALSLIWFQVNGLTYKAGETATISGVGTIQMDANGSLTFTPLLNYYGTVPTINYTISDPTGSTSSADVLITVTPVNDPPVADNDTNDTPEDTPVSGTLFNNDRDIDGDTFTVTGVSLDGITFVVPGTELTVTGGKITINADGTYTFTPSLNFNGTVSPIYYEISDPGNLTSNAARLDILVGPENDLPVAVDDVKTTLEDVAVSGNVITDLNASSLKDSDPENDPLVILDFTVDGKTYDAGVTVPLPGIGTLVINSDGSYTFTPALDFDGAVPVITYTLADNNLDGTDGVDTATLTITITPVNDAPKAIKDLNNTPEDTPVSDNVLANDSDVDGDVITVTGFSVSGQSYAAGITATITGVGTLKINADGSYTFTPNTNYNGQIPQVTYTITDGAFTDTATLDIYVAPVNDAPVAVADTKTEQEDNTATGNVLTNDTDAEGGFLTVTQFVIDGQTYTSGQTATLNGIGTLVINTDGSYTFIPVLNYNGTVPVATYTVSDADGATATATLTITVSPDNDPPIANDDSGVVTEDTPLSGDVLLNDSDLDGLSLSVTDFKIGTQTYAAGTTATISGVGTLVINSDGSWTFTPAANYTGSIPSADYTLSDGAGGTDAGQLSLTITPVNDAPVAVNDAQTILEDATATGNVLTNDTDVESNTLTVTGFKISGQSYTAGQTATLNGVGTLVINSNGTYTFTPVANYNGTAPVATYSISDGNGGTASATLTITVTPVNDPPVANDDSGVVTEDTPLSGDVLLNDSDLDGISLSVNDFTVDNQTYTAGQTATIAGVGTLVINSDGSWTFTPDANYTGAIPSADYTLSDGAGGTDVGTLSLTITPVNDAPVAVNDAQTILEDATATGNVLTNDTDVESNTLTVTGFTINGQSYNAGQTATLNGVGTLVINSNGTYTFTPVANYNGTAPVATYSNSDGNGGTATATLTITVTPVNDPPVANDDSGVVTEDTPLSGDVLLNDSDLDGISLSVNDFTVDNQTYTAGQTATIAGVGTLVINSDGSWTFTPAADYTGAIPLADYTLSDGAGGTDIGQLSLTITAVNDAPVASSDAQTITEDATATGNVLTNDTDIESNTLSVTGFTINGQSFTAGQTATLNGVGTLVINSDGTYTFTPELNYNGSVPVATYSISDGNGGTASATLTVTVTPGNDPPVAGDESKVLDVNESVSGDLFPNDSDLDGDSFTVSGFTVAGLTGVFTPGTPLTITGVGVLTINTDGTWTFVPVNGYAGNIPVVTYTIDDGNGGTDTATLSLNITVRDSDGDGIPDYIEKGPNYNSPLDTDGDGTPDYLDSDSDGDGIPDNIEDTSCAGNSTCTPTDTDNDGTPDYLDSDSDGDGIPDEEEKGADGDNPVDTDGDGNPDYLDADSDGDGIPDSIEDKSCTGSSPCAPTDTDGDGKPDHLDSDSDGDGIPDQQEKGADGNNPVDTDGDGTPDYLDADSDGDGLPDSIEDNSCAGTAPCTPTDSDGDGTPNYLDADSDGDGIPDSIEDKSCTGTSSCTPTDTDNDGTPDYLDADSDGDGIPDKQEKGADGNNPVDTDNDGTPDYLDADSDGDGLPDSIEDKSCTGTSPCTPTDTDNDGTPDYLDADSDGDGLPDSIEDKSCSGTTPCSPTDTDNDGTPDYLDSDSDGDGIPDQQERGADGNNPVDTDNDGTPDYLDADSDGDGLPDSIEDNSCAGTAPCTPTDSDGDGTPNYLDADSDDDGIPDSIEDKSCVGILPCTPTDTDSDGTPDYLDSDSDGDGIPDQQEKGADGNNPVDSDSDGTPDYLDSDSDGDGLPDSIEDKACSGTAPCTPTDTDGDGTPDYKDLDSDGDGVPDQQEKGADGNNPVDTDNDGTPDYLDSDSDGDGMPDSVEDKSCTGTSPCTPTDTDVDGTPDYLDSDSDGDGITDQVEKGADGNNPVDTDNDGTSDYLDADSDGDGIPDSIEDNLCTSTSPCTPTDTDGDGTPDYRDLDSDGDGIPDSVEDSGCTGTAPCTPTDSDGDGTPDFQEADSDGDGIPDDTEKGANGNNPVDTDNDGTPDYLDTDSDGDGIPDSIEDKSCTGTSPCTPTDTDSDGTPDYQDLDSDGDGITDAVEKGADGTNPVDKDGDGVPDYLDADSDGDGIPDSIEDKSCTGANPCTPTDTDNDGTPDYLDQDSDADGITDQVEKGADGNNPVDTDSDGTPDYLDSDSDGDSIPDYLEDSACAGTSPCTPTDSDNDGTPDFRDLDSDGDGITDEVEKGVDGSNPIDTDNDGTPDYLDSDSDGDGIPDSIEDTACSGTNPCTPTDTDGDGTPDYRDLDSDGDGIPDNIEDKSCTGTAPCTPTDTDGDGTPDHLDLDSDGDGIPDATEKGADGNNPVDTDNDGTPDYLDTDSDGDGIPDNIEDRDCTGVVPCTPTDSDNDGTPDYLDTDSDGDAITDQVEKGADGNNPVDSDSDGTPDYLDSDSDGDGIPDNIEDNSCTGVAPCVPTDTDGDGTPDYLDLDSDSDGLPDEFEKGADGNNPVDSDNDGKPDFQDLDSDGDGIPDSIEDNDCAGALTCTPTDSDNDGTPDYLDSDSDGDGIPDSIEDKSCTGTSSCTPTDTDSDGTPDHLDLDSDGDGIPDETEKGADGNNPVDTDNDGTPDHQDLDSDGDGIPDSLEDKNCTGVVPCTPTDSDNDGTPDYRDLDSDGDGIPDSIEDKSCTGSSSCTPTDTDSDGTPDHLDLDSDGDGIPDETEKGADGNSPVDTDNDGTPDYQDLESDGDGIPDSIEDKSCSGTSPCTPTDTDGDGKPDYLDLDSDADGITDQVEKGTDGNNPVDTDADGTPDYLDADSDADGIPDSIEDKSCTGVAPCIPTDTDGDGKPDYLDLDSDGDGIPDSIEDKSCSGTSPCTPTDTDGDGTSDYQDLDSDGDGIPDMNEKGANGNNPVDTDADGVPDYLDTDSDNDGVLDSLEDGACSGTVPCTPTDTDNDGIPNHLDPDSDNDGCSDAIESYGDAAASGTDGNAFYGNGNPPAVNIDGTVTGATYNVTAAGYERATTAATASTITTQPTDQLGVVGTPEIFTAVVKEGTGAATTYQWQYSTDGVNFQNVTDAGLYSGFTTPSLTINSVTVTMQGYSFRLIVAQPLFICAGETSAIAKLTVNSNPVAVDDAVTTSVIDPTSGAVLTNDSDPDGNPLVVTQFVINGTTYQAGQSATITGIGTIVINANGNFTFTPVQFFTGNIPVITYTVSDGKGGTDTADLVLKSDPLLIIEANDDNFRSKPINAATGGNAGNIFINDSVNSAPVVPSAVTVEVTDDDGLTGIRIEAGNVIIPPNAKPGIYTLTYKLCQNGVPDNCDTATIIVQVADFGVVVPEGISPDGDGLNDKWIINGLDNYPNHELTLYNRWGNLIIRRKPYNNDWDGKSDNALTINSDERVPAGTYYWVIDLGTGKRLTGFVYLAY